MALEYIKHNRTASPEDIRSYGRIADHDLRCPLLVMYELGQIPDKNGTLVKVDRKFLEALTKDTNDWIKNRKRNPMAKFIGKWLKPLDKINAIKLIKDHESKVDNVIGYTEGLLYTEEMDGVLAVMVTAVITDLEAKKKVEEGNLRETSLGTRKGGSIREISFVVNEAAPLCGLMFGEKIDFQPHTNHVIGMQDQPVKIIESDKAHDFAEEISELEFEEQELIHTIIPNHNRISKLIKAGKVFPFQRAELLRNTEMIEFAERSIPARNLGLMLGSAQPPQLLNIDNMQFQESLEKAKKEFGIKTVTDIETKEKGAPLISKGIDNFEEARETELKRILELAEIDSSLAVNYIKCELAMEEATEYKDVQLSEYMARVGEIRTKLTELKQFQPGDN